MTARWRALAAIAVLTASSPARGFVRERVTEDCELVDDFGCAPIAWHERNCVPIDIYMNGTADMTRDEAARALGAAAHAWSPSAVACTATARPPHPYLEIIPGMAADDAKPPPVANDSHNVLIFQSEWPLDLPFGAVAVTTIAKKKDGRILDADIEINDQWFPWANLDPGAPTHGQGDLFDLQNAITHEFGHFLGLGHTCDAGNDANTFDDKGTPVPVCGSPDETPEIRGSVMYAIVETGETSKRVLSPDDVAGICTIYPTADDPKLCTLDLPDDGCGCASGGGARTIGGLAFGLAFAALARLRSGRARRGGRGRTPRPAPPLR